MSTSAGFTDGTRADQPSIAVGPWLNGSAGSVWVTFAAGSPLHLSAAGAPVTGLGAVGDFTPVAIMPRPADTPGSPIVGNHGGIDIGPNGQVVVTYQDGTEGPGPANIYVNLDPDGLGPEGFKPAVVVPAPATPGSRTGPPTRRSAALTASSDATAIRRAGEAHQVEWPGKHRVGNVRARRRGMWRS